MPLIGQFNHWDKDRKHIYLIEFESGREKKNSSPRQDTEPEIDVMNWVKRRSVIGRSISEISREYGWRASPAFISLSGRVTCTAHNISKLMCNSLTLKSSHNINSHYLYAVVSWFNLKAERSMAVTLDSAEKALILSLRRERNSVVSKLFNSLRKTGDWDVTTHAKPENDSGAEISNRTPKARRQTPQIVVYLLKTFLARILTLQWWCLAAEGYWEQSSQWPAQRTSAPCACWWYKCLWSYSPIGMNHLL